MSARQKSDQEIADFCEKLYRERIKPLIKYEEDRGKFVVIDVNSGDYEIDQKDAVATRRLIDQRSDAYTYAIRIGRPTAYRMTGLKTRNRSCDSSKS